MIHPFVSSRRTRPFGFGGAAVSIAIHAVLLAALAIVGDRAIPTVRGLPGMRPERIVRHTLIFARPAPPGTAIAVPDGASVPKAAARRSRAPIRSATRRRRSPPAPPRPQLAVPSYPLPSPELRIAVPAPGHTEAASPDYAAMASAGLDFGVDSLVGGIVQAIGSAFARPEANGAYRVEVVDRQVHPRRGNPVPEYPRQLLRREIEAAYQITFVVDSTGRVDRESVRFPDDAHPLFVASIRRALYKSRYDPAMIGGRPVAQLVEQQFMFRITHQGSRAGYP